MVDLIIYPLDTIKTRVQAGSGPNSTREKPGLGQITTFRQGLSRLPVRDLYSGAGSAVLATVPAASIFFVTYHNVQQALLPSVQSIIGSNEDLGWKEKLQRYPRFVLANVIASVVAELASDAILTPCELVKQRAQMYQLPERKKVQLDSKGQPMNLFSRWKLWFRSSPSIRATWEIFMAPPAESGPHPPLARTLGRGYIALASRNLPFVGLQFPLYEEFRMGLTRYQGIEYGEKAHLKYPKDIVRSGLTSAFAASMAGGLAAGVTTPLDVAKTRIMLGLDGADGTVWKTMGSIWRNEGWQGLMKGSKMRASWAALGAGVYLSTYETGRQWLAARHAAEREKKGNA